MSRDELILALRSWHDFFPLPATWTGELQRRSAPRGPAPYKRVTCGECDGRGRLRGGWLCKPCNGRGTYWIDAYTGLQVDAADDTSWKELLGDVVNCSKCGGWGRLCAHAETRPDPKTAPLCDRCDGVGKVPAPLTRGGETEGRTRQGDRVLNALDDQRERRDQLSSYREIAVAMDELKAAMPGTHFLVCWVFVLEVQRISPANEHSVDEGLGFLVDRLENVSAPKFIQRQANEKREAMIAARGREADTRAQAIRNQEIKRRRFGDGAKLAELAEEFGLDKGQISRIVRAP